MVHQNYENAHHHFQQALQHHPEHLPSLAKMVLLHQPDAPLQDLNKAWQYAHQYNQTSRLKQREMLLFEYRLLMKMGRQKEAQSLSSHFD